MYFLYFCFLQLCGIVCVQSLWSVWREEKSIFRSLHELSIVSKKIKNMRSSPPPFEYPWLFLWGKSVKFWLMNAKTDLTSVLSQISHFCHHHHHHYDHHHFRTRAMYLVDWQIQSWPIKSFETVSDTRWINMDTNTMLVIIIQLSLQGRKP